MFEDLIQTFNSLQRKRDEPTFMEIGGFPHYEQVISNFLAFFLNPYAEHGLHDLFLLAFQKELGAEDFPADITVETEVDNIDILVTSGSHILAIENKIFHHAEANPFERYVQTVKQRYAYHRHHFVLLTLVPEVAASRRHELRRLGYAVITYASLFARVRDLMGKYAERASPRYWLILLDLIKTIDNLARGSSFNMQSIEFFAEHAVQLTELQKQITALRAELRNKVYSLHTLVQEMHPGLLGQAPASGGAYHRDNDNLFQDTFYVEITFPDGRIAFDVVVTLKGWEIYLVPRSANMIESTRLKIAAAGWAHDVLSDRFRLIGLPLPQAINADLGEVAEVATQVLKRLIAFA